MTLQRDQVNNYLQNTGILVTECNDEYQSATDPAILVLNPGFYKRVVQYGNLGFGESYMDGWCDVKRLDEMYWRVLKSDVADRIASTNYSRLREIVGKFANLQKPWRAKRDTNLHYDLGNEFFKVMLGDVMSYTCGYWSRPDMTLGDANNALFDLICRKLGLKPGMHILDAGCGWGAFLEYAARNYGVSGIGVNISKRQLEMCEEKCAGLPIEFVEKDCRYLDVKQYAKAFDRVTAIALINHIGHKSCKRFFNVLSAVLKDDGLLLVHGQANRIRTFVNDDFFNRYIFRNGVAMSMSQLLRCSEPTLVMEDFQNIAAHYPKSLMAWHENLRGRWAELEPLGFDHRFHRMWNLYLLGATALFRASRLQLYQIVFRKWGALPVYTGVR